MRTGSPGHSLDAGPASGPFPPRLGLRCTVMIEPSRTIQGVGDFNGDGKADILWRHTSGSLYIWELNGPSVIGTGSPGGASTDWQIE